MLILLTVYHKPKKIAIHILFFIKSIDKLSILSYNNTKLTLLTYIQKKDMAMNQLDEARKIINDVDAKMAELFCERMRAVDMVAEYKKEHGISPQKTACHE